MINSRKWGELDALLHDKPLNLDKLNRYFNRLSTEEKSELIEIINTSNMEKLALLKEAANLKVLREESLYHMITWKRWRKSVRKMRPTALMVSIVALYITAKGIQSPIWTESILKAGIVTYGGLWIWQKIVEGAINGAKNRFNKRLKRFHRTTREFFRKYGLRDDGSIPVIPKLNRRDAK